MPAEDVIAALQGFAGAYGKIASQYDPEAQYQLRVVAVKTASFELAIGTFVALVIADSAVQLKTADTIVKATRWIVETIGVLIDAKRASKGKPLEVRVNGKNNTVVIIGADGGGTVALSPDQFKLLESKLVDGDLDRIAAPLKEDSIDRVELSIDAQPLAEINSAEREYFRKEETLVATSKEAEIDGKLISLNKETNRGTFRLMDGRSIPYHYKGDDDSQFHRAFGLKGPVRVSCIAHLDESLTVKKIDISKLDNLQGSLLPADVN
jgi:hypothetical protein